MRWKTRDLILRFRKIKTLFSPDDQIRSQLLKKTEEIKLLSRDSAGNHMHGGTTGLGFFVIKRLHTKLEWHSDLLDHAILFSSSHVRAAGQKHEAGREHTPVKILLPL